MTAFHSVGGGAVSLLGEQAFAGVAAVDFTGLDWSKYRRFLLSISGEVTADANMLARFSRAGTFMTGGTDYFWSIGGYSGNTMSNDDSSMRLGWSIYKGGAGYNEGFAARYEILPASSGLGASIIGHMAHCVPGTGNRAHSDGTGSARDASFAMNPDGVRLLLSAGNMTGTAWLEGVKA